MVSSRYDVSDIVCCKSNVDVCMSAKSFEVAVDMVKIVECFRVETFAVGVDHVR